MSSVRNEDGTGAVPAKVGFTLQRDQLMALAQEVKSLKGLRAFLTDTLASGDPKSSTSIPPKWAAEALDTVCRAVLASPMTLPDVRKALDDIWCAARRVPDADWTPILDDCEFVLVREPQLIGELDRRCDLQPALASSWVDALSGTADSVWRQRIEQFAARGMRTEFWLRFHGGARSLKIPDSIFAEALPPDVISQFKDAGVILHRDEQALHMQELSDGWMLPTPTSSSATLGVMRAGDPYPDLDSDFLEMTIPA